VSARAHRGQKRESGEAFLSHSVAVATILAEQQLDATTIAAALLHDVVEDSNVSLDDIRKDFGAEIAGIVDGLTKLSSLTFRSSAEEQAENYRKLLTNATLIDRRHAQLAVFRHAEKEYEASTGERVMHWQRRLLARYTRNLALAGNELVAGIFV